ESPQRPAHGIRLFALRLTSRIDPDYCRLYVTSENSADKE
ncbi:MAG: hypothetical protein ACI87H_002845, partial [Gammaproteobacteria bacterium]